MDNYVIETKQVSKYYGKLRALDRVDCHVLKGSIYGLIGDNGAGKSTLLKLLAGHIFADGGEICLLGQWEEKALEKMRRRTGVLIETPGFYPNLTVEKMMEYCRIQKGVPGKRKVEEILRLTGIWEKRKVKCAELSLGQKQRMGLAIAMIGEPQVLILDEPINGLDPSGMAEMRSLFLRLKREKNMTILLSSHILTELQQVADTFGFLYDGRLLGEISSEALHEKCADYLDLDVTDPQTYAVLLEKYCPGEDYKVLPDFRIQIRNPKLSPEKYSRLAAEHQVYVRELSRRHATLEEYYMNLKKEGERSC